MFTGLIEQTGRIERIDGTSDGRRIRVTTGLGAELSDGDSIAVNGVCLTVTSCDVDGFAADLTRQTLAVTSFSNASPGVMVNLERPVRADARLGGHFVLGHVDSTASITAFGPDGDGYWLEVQIPAALDIDVLLGLRPATSGGGAVNDEIGSR